MIEVAEALDKILSKVPKNPVVEIGLTSALNCVLAENVYSPISMPPFNQSAMDGY
ncbi:MAG: molybdopterin molybdenumtransferase MoeA, partial [Crocinitomicaceae bacterium]|nr:molybdopterin molybdenumtransferase MoeA [Crocinitomicaceae bacterium]